MYVFTDSYSDVVRWKNNKIVNVEELESNYETYSSLDDLIYDVKQNIRDILYLNEGFLVDMIFYAVEINDTTGEFIKVHTLQMEIKIKEVKDGKEITTIEKELKELADIKQRAENKYDDGKLVLKLPIEDINDRNIAIMACAMMLFAGEILGFSEDKITKDMQEMKKERIKNRGIK